MTEGNQHTAIWSRRSSHPRGNFWKFECDVMQKHSEKRKVKYQNAEPEILFVVSLERPSANYFKGRPKGIPQKSKPCQHCQREYAPNMKTCPNCLKPTGFWSNTK